MTSRTHHALTSVIEPLFEARFVSQSFAFRRGLGTHAALDCAARAARHTPYVLKCDVRRYFDSVDHIALLEVIARVIKCRPTLALIETILRHGPAPPQEPVYFPGDSLFTPLERPRGLPLGNQTSQFFTNVYLNPLDHFVMQLVKPKQYVRYVDDLLLFGDRREELAGALKAMEEFLIRFRLRFHPTKSAIYETSGGFPFLGWRIYPERRRLMRRNVVRFRRKLRAMRDEYMTGAVDWKDVRQSVAAWIGHSQHGDTWRLREQIFDAVGFGPRPLKTKGESK